MSPGLAYWRAAEIITTSIRTYLSRHIRTLRLRPRHTSRHWRPSMSAVNVGRHFWRPTMTVRVSRWPTSWPSLTAVNVGRQKQRPTLTTDIDGRQCRPSMSARVSRPLTTSTQLSEPWSARCTFRFSAPRTWNTLPKSVTDSDSLGNTAKTFPFCRAYNWQWHDMTCCQRLWSHDLTAKSDINIYAAPILNIWRCTVLQFLWLHQGSIFVPWQYHAAFLLPVQWRYFFAHSAALH